LTKKTPYKGPSADSEEKHEPASDIDTVAVVESLKVLDPKWPIREADIVRRAAYVRFVWGKADMTGKRRDFRVWIRTGPPLLCHLARPIRRTPPGNP
jgi:hypothetical protein